LLPQDVLVLAKLVNYRGARPPIAQVAGDLALSPSQVHASLKHLDGSRLIDARTGPPLLKAVEEFRIHDVKCVFPAQRGETSRGMPTARSVRCDQAGSVSRYAGLRRLFVLTVDRTVW
jgi:hypothetical protein